MEFSGLDGWGEWRRRILGVVVLQRKHSPVPIGIPKCGRCGTRELVDLGVGSATSCR
jgi:hypothetical protein